MRRISCVILTITIAVLLSGCGGMGKPMGLPTGEPISSPVQSMQPSAATTLSPVSSQTPTVSMSTPGATDMPSQTPSPSESMEPEETPYSGDLPAYLQAGLPTWNKMSEWMERYYYEPDSFVTDEESDKYNIWFENETSTDLDGDGKDDSIKLLPGEKKNVPEEEQDSTDGNYVSITVSINGKELKLSEKSYTFGMGETISGIILDIDKNDGKKELCVESGSGEACKDYLITFDGNAPKIIYLLYDQNIQANGSGYIMQDREIKVAKNKYIFCTVLRHLKADHSGLEDADLPYIHTDYLNYYLDEETPAITMWNQKLAVKPGEGETVNVKKGTLIYFGLYEKRGWLEVLDEKGNLLGWLNIQKHDEVKYVDYAFDDYINRP